MKNKKLILSIGTVALAASPVAIAVSCSSWTGQKPKLENEVDLTMASVGTWHVLFHTEGRSLPKDGMKLKVKMGSTTYSYVWTSEDSAAVTPAGYDKGEKSITDILSYVAKRLATAGGDAESIFNAFGVSGHGSPSINNSVDMNGAPANHNAVVEAVPGAPEPAKVFITGMNGWHTLFKAGTPDAGTVMRLPIGEQITKFNVDGTDKEILTTAAKPEKPAGKDSYEWYENYSKGRYYWALSEKVLDYTWGAKEDASTTAKAWRDRTIPYATVVKYVENLFISKHTMYLYEITTSIKKYSAGHTIQEDNGYVAKRTETVTFQIHLGNVYKNANNQLLASTCADSWHYLFALDIAHGGRTLPIEGDKFVWENISYTWKESDNDVIQDYLTMTNGWNQWKVTEYVAARVAQGNKDAFWGILSTLGRNHNADSVKPGYEWPSLANQTISLNPVSSTSGPSSSIWHPLSGFGDDPTTFVAGNKLVLFANNKYYEHTITAANVAAKPVNVSTTPEAAAKWIAGLLSTDATLQTQLIAAMGFQGQNHGGGFIHAGTTVTPTTPVENKLTPATTFPDGTTTAAVSSVWHKLVGYNNVSTFVAGNTMSLKVDGTTVTYTITATDVKNKPADFAVNEKAAVAYVANIMLTQFPTKTLDDIYRAMGFTGQEHGRPGDETHQGTGDATLWLIGRNPWHNAFYYKVPKAGTQLVLPTAASEINRTTGVFTGAELVRYTWTEADVNSATSKAWLAGTISQGEMMKYLYNKFVAVGAGMSTAVDEETVKTAFITHTGGHDVIVSIDPTLKRTTAGIFNLQTGGLNATAVDGALAGTSVSGAWHVLFAQNSGHGGRSLPVIGDVIMFDQNANSATTTKKYVWTAADNIALSGWLTFDLNQWQVMEYVANKVFNVTAQSSNIPVEWYYMLELGSKSPLHAADSANGNGRPSYWKTVYKLDKSSTAINANIAVLQANFNEGLYIGVGTNRYIITAADVTGKPANFATDTTAAIDYIATIMAKGDATLKATLITAMTYTAPAAL